LEDSQLIDKLCENERKIHILFKSIHPIAIRKNRLYKPLPEKRKEKNKGNLNHILDEYIFPLFPEFEIIYRNCSNSVKTQLEQQSA